MNKTAKAPDLMELTLSNTGQQPAGCRPNLLSLPLSVAWMSMPGVTLEATCEWHFSAWALE